LFNWYDNKESFLSYSRSIRKSQDVIEGYFSKQKHITGYCHICNKITKYSIHTGVMFGDKPNLREGMICECGLSNRNRLVYLATNNKLYKFNDPKILLFERLSMLYDLFSSAYPNVIGTEYLGGDKIRGNVYEVNGKNVRNESITELTFDDESFDCIVHNDILEHIYHYKSALKESYRLLRKNGVNIFTCPFFIHQDENVIMASLNEDRTIEYHEEPEYHGDPMNPRGILVFYHYGWKLLDDMRKIGFRNVRAGVFYNPFYGFTSNNHPEYEYANMLPIIIRAEK